MSSILTNTSAMVALQTLRSTNSNLESVQSEISTGKKIADSTDNAAIWSIATVMEADVSSFDQVSDSLNLGSATVGVARSGASEVTDLLQEAKTLIVAANDPSLSDTDRSKYQADLTELTGNIGSIVDAASFNGQNLLKGSGDIEILASLNRQDDGTVDTGKIAVARTDLSTAAAVTGTEVAGTAATGAAFAATTVADNDGAADGTTTLTIAEGTTTEPTTYSFSVGGADVSYVAAAGLDQDAIAEGLKGAIDTAIASTADPDFAGADISGTFATSDVDVSGGDAVITLTNSAAADAGDVALTQVATFAGAEAEGGLAGLAEMNIGSAEGAAEALDAIDGLLQTAIDATAQFGSKQKRIDNQNEFVTTLKDSLKTGIGAMTDANLEEASARLQSLQVQQQLGVQALSIANQSPQSLLSLFR